MKSSKKSWSALSELALQSYLAKHPSDRPCRIIKISSMCKSNAGKLNFHLFCALTFFSFGTAMMDYFLVYPSRAIVGDKEFIAYHTLLENAILPINVLPFFIITIQNVFLF